MKGLTFVDNIAAGVDKLGLENSPIIFALAKVRWESIEDRDAVMDYLGAPDASA